MSKNINIVNETNKTVPKVSWDIIFDSASRLLGKELEPVSLVFKSKEEIQKINKEYRGHNKATNVLSFTGLRDILISLDVVEEEAQQMGIEKIDWTSRLFVHGILHLEGYGHQTDEEAGEMERIEKAILESLE